MCHKCCVINCPNMNCVTTCKVKYFCLVTLKVLPTNCSRYNSEEKGPKFSIPKTKQNRINASFSVKFFFKAFGGSRKNDKFLKIFLSIYLETFTHSFQSFTKCFTLLLLDGLLIFTNKGSIACKCFRNTKQQS